MPFVEEARRGCPPRLPPLNRALNQQLRRQGAPRASDPLRRILGARDRYAQTHRPLDHTDHRRRPDRDRSGCEFDYSGVQACKALRAEGYRIVLVNSNPATIMTDPELADATYIEPITPEIVEKIIAKERHVLAGGFALLPTMGGQTALNTALALERSGALAKHDVEMIGARAEVIDKAEDRQKFRDAMDHLGLESPKSRAIHHIDEAADAVEFVGLPAIIRPVLHPRRHGRRHRLQHGRGARDRDRRPRPFAHHRGLDRGERARLEGVRNGGGSR